MSYLIIVQEQHDGVMSRSVDDLELAARTIFGVQGRNHDVAPVPYRENVSLPKPKFGYYTSGK